MRPTSFKPVLPECDCSFICYCCVTIKGLVSHDMCSILNQYVIMNSVTEVTLKNKTNKQKTLNKDTGHNHLGLSLLHNSLTLLMKNITMNGIKASLCVQSSQTQTVCVLLKSQ